MRRMASFTARLWNDEEGATSIEYGLLAALVSVIIIAAGTAISTQVQNSFDDVTVISAPAAGERP